MSKKDKKLAIIGGTGLVALIVVLVFQFKPEGTPAGAQASQTAQSLSLRTAVDAVARALKAGRHVETVRPVSDVKLPLRDPFEVSELLQRRFGKKPSGPSSPTAQSTQAGVPAFDEQKWLQGEAARIDGRKTHFESTYAIKIIMEGADGYEATVFDGKQHRLLAQADRVEDCVVVRVTADSVLLKSVEKATVDTTRTVKCRTLNVDGARAAWIDGHAYRVGQVCRGWIVKKVEEDSVLLEMPSDSPLRAKKPLPFSVRLKMRTN